MSASICAASCLDHVFEPLEIVLGSLEPQLRLVAARMQAGDSGGLLEHAPALLGLRLNDLADPALVHQSRRPRAGRGVGEQDVHVAGAHLAAVDAVDRAVVALDAAGDLQRVELVEGGGRGARRELSTAIETSAMLRAGRPPVPEKITSSMSAARMALCEVSPITQRSASTRFDLPQPFGPTTPVSPGSITKSDGSTKDLKPIRRSRVSFMQRIALHRPATTRSTGQSAPSKRMRRASEVLDGISLDGTSRNHRHARDTAATPPREGADA